jgi:hypothetical protein
MALSADQKAALQLLLERGQSYGDLAELLGIEETEVRERARSAMRELTGTDPDRSVAISDYLLGQADPIGRADVVRHLRENPDDNRLAGELVARLREVVPGADLPRLPGEPREGRFLRRFPGAREDTAGADRPSLADRLPEGRARLLVAHASGAVLLIAVVRALTGAFGGDDDADSVAATTSPETTTAGAEGEEVQLPLTPVGGSDAAGVVTFGFASADQPFVDIQLRNLQPATRDQAYVMWFLTDRDAGYPLPTTLEVDAQGRYSDRLAVPAAVFSIVQQSASVVIALVDREDLARDIGGAVQNQEGTLRFPGGTVLEAQLRLPEGG